MVEERDMSYIPMEDLLEKIESRYKLVILASQRAGELNNGGRRLVDVNPRLKISTVALEEIREGKIEYREKAGKK